MKSDGGKSVNGTGSKTGINVGKEDLETLRKKLGVPETQTIAIGKTDVKGLEGKVFEGGYPKLEKKQVYQVWMNCILVVKLKPLITEQ